MLLSSSPLARKFVATPPFNQSHSRFRTGLPKGVVSTHRNFLHMLRNVRFILIEHLHALTLGIFQATIGSLRAYLREGLDLPKPPLPGEPQTGMLVGVPLFHISGLSFSVRKSCLASLE